MKHGLMLHVRMISISQSFPPDRWRRSWWCNSCSVEPFTLQLAIIWLSQKVDLKSLQESGPRKKNGSKHVHWWPSNITYIMVCHFYTQWFVHLRAIATIPASCVAATIPAGERPFFSRWNVQLAVRPSQSLAVPPTQIQGENSAKAYIHAAAKENEG